jgi:hypothetical protein
MNTMTLHRTFATIAATLVVVGVMALNAALATASRDSEASTKLSLDPTLDQLDDPVDVHGFRVRGTLVGSDRAAPLVLAFDTIRVPDGLAASEAVGFDATADAQSPSPGTPQAAAWDNLHPWVRTYSAWNELNHVSQPTSDVLDPSNVRSYLARESPSRAGMHNYQDVNRHTAPDTRTMLDKVTGEVWLTETGGLVRFARVDAGLVGPDETPPKAYSTSARSTDSRVYSRIVPADTIEAAAGVTPDEYPPEGQEFFQAFGERCGEDNPDPYALYGYETMRSAIDLNRRWDRLAEFPASADEQRNPFVSGGADEFSGGNPLEHPASLPHVMSAPAAAPDALLAVGRPPDALEKDPQNALENADSDIGQALATF